MNSFETELAARLEAIHQEGLYRELRQFAGPQSPHLKLAASEWLNFSSNDYLGLATHPALKEAAARAVERYGTGSGASRLISGSLAVHHELEESLAAFKNTEAALTFSSGYTAASGAICALLDKGDILVVDRLVHACVIDAARLCGAKLRVFGHNDLDDLERILKWATRNSGGPQQTARVLIVTESVFSMDGDLAPLKEMVRLKERYGAWLMVDEAHATGLFGARRSGLVEELGLTGQVEVQMATLGKALGAAGGCLCGSRRLIDYLVNRARSFIFSTAPAPASAAAARAAVELVQSTEGQELLARLWRVVNRLKKGVMKAGWPIEATHSAILPLMVGNEQKAVALANKLRAGGVFVPAIRYPSVARGAARLRLTATAAHTNADVDGLLAALVSVRNDLQEGTPDA